jgi:hypothetical protein
MFDESNKTIETSTLHSILKGTPGNDWVLEYEKNEQKVTCFFGAHLLAMYPNNPIVLVEAPKTAIYGTCYYGPPKSEKDLLWLAVYNKSSLTEEKFKILEGRNIILIPDLSTDSATFKDWSEKAKRFANKLNRTTVGFFDFLERNAPKELIKAGGDFADYLAQFSWEQFNQQNLGCESDESGESAPEKKHFFIAGVDNFPTDKLILLFEPFKGYSLREIIDLLECNDYNLNLGDSERIIYLIKECVIKKDGERNNYYRFDSLPF